MSVFEELSDFLSKHNCQLVAVSKTKPIEAILELYNKGQRIFGENRVQELVEKQKLLPDDIQWHLIGHLQKNKVKHIASFVSMIHSIDNISLLKLVDKKAKESDRNIDILLQIKIARETEKYGFEINELLDTLRPDEYPNLNFKGVMGMATFTEDEAIVRSEFKILASHRNMLKEKLFPHNDEFQELSMGMSGDYKIAIEEGSTMVRIGSLLFGNRS